MKTIRVSPYVRERIGRDKNDFILQTFRAGGKGGQHQNKTESAVRLIDKETGLSAECREYREQPQNKEAAFLKLVEKLQRHYEAEEAALREKWEALKEVRVYKEKGDTVKDHTTGKTYSYKRTLEAKDLMEIVKDRQQAALDALD